MAIKSGVKVKGKGLGQALKSLNFLSGYNVVVGIPESEAVRDDPEISNAEIGYINEFGSPLQNIPAREHLVPGVESVEDRTTKILKRASKLAADNKTDEALKALDAAGTVAADAVKRYIGTHEFEPLSEVTLHNRKNRKVAPRKGEKPLIDTGEYRRSITYEVREK